MTMYEKFSHLLETSNVTPYRIHKETGISTATLSDWKNGKSEPKKDKIQKICDFFGISISYFYEESPMSKSSNMTFFEQLEELRNATGISQGKLEKELGISNGSISKWRNSTPTIKTMQKIADYFGVTVDYLTSGKEKKEFTFTQKDELDISRRLEKTLADLGNQQSALMFDGDPLDEETKELLKASLEHSIRVAKINAKKYTNKRYLNSSNQEK